MVRICRLIEAAATEAIRSGQERIDLEMLHGDLVASLGYNPAVLPLLAVVAGHGSRPLAAAWPIRASIASFSCFWVCWLRRTSSCARSGISIPPIS